MSSMLLLLIALVITAGLLFFVPHMLKVYLRYRGQGVVICPETRRPVSIEVDAKHAALSLTRGEPDLRLNNCSRWPERAGCDQECLSQVEWAPENCMVQMMLANWYKNKSCVYCGKLFEKINWTDHKPALLNLNCKTVGWKEIRPEELYDALTTHLPVCWNCHVAETFRREHPELVVDRPWKSGVHVKPARALPSTE